MASRELNIPYTELDGFSLYLMGSDDAVRDGFVNVVSQDLLRGGAPVDGGIYDAHMGTTDHSWDCKTCHHEKKYCEGHSGYIALKYPVLNPLFIRQIIKWLKVICFGCGKPVIKLDADPSHPLRTNLTDLAGKVGKTVKCAYCETIHPHIVKDKTDYVSVTAEVYDISKISSDRGKLQSKFPLYPHLIKMIFDKVPEWVLVRLGQPLESHPRNLVLTHLRAPPNTVRPNINKLGGGRSNNNDLTVLMQMIMKFNERLPNTIPKTIDQDMQVQIHNINLGVYELIKGSSATSTKRKLTSSNKNAQLTAIAKRLPRKDGRIRKNLNGRRVQHMARSSITCDPSLPLDTIGIPIAIAKNIQIPEVVRDYNFKQMEIYFMNGTQRYPGCTKIQKARSGAVFWVGKANTVLEVGDIIFRDVIDGDEVNFNRQPSLESSSISCVKVRVMPRGGTIRFNVMICSLFGADFDGDEMNILFPQNKRTVNEISKLASVKQFFISYKNARPKIGQAQDSVIGMATLTESKVAIDKLHAMRIFGPIPVTPNFKSFGFENANSGGKGGAKGSEKCSGRDIITYLLQNTNNKINFSTRAGIYDTSQAPYRTYDPLEVNVRIDRGALVSGMLDGNSIAGGVRGSISHVIHNKSGSQAALDITFQMQQIALTYQFNRGNSINVGDFMLSEYRVEKVREVESMLIADSERITTQLHAGKIIPPIGKTITEHYENLQLNALNPGDAFYEHIITGINVHVNNFYKMVITGSRGKFYNFKNVVAAIGSIEINGERMKEIFGGRVLPYFVKDDKDPRSRGYVANSYISGVDSAEYMFLTMQERYQLINKALSTSITGEQNRRAIKNLESTVVDNQRKLVKDRRVIQFLYGGDGVDARYLEFVGFPTMQRDLTDKAFADKFHTKASAFGSKFSNAGVQKLLDAEFAQLQSDREEFRRIFMNFEYTRNTPYTDKANLPVNVGRIIDDVVFNFQLKPNVKQPGLDPVSALARISEFLSRVDYVLINEIQWRNKAPIPQFMKNATKLLKINLRSYLNLATLLREGINDKALDIVLRDIFVQYQRSLIGYGMSVGILAAQSISEPMTQMVLDSHKTAAAKSTRKQGMFRIKEILGAKPTDKMKAPSMTMFPVEEYRKNKAKVQEIANHIEMMELRRFVKNWQLFFEEYGNPRHEQYKYESIIAKEFAKYNVHIKPPADLTNWVLRLALDKSEMILKQMKVETIYDKLRTLYPSLFIIYSHDNSDQIVLRIHIRNSFYKKGSITVEQLQNLMEEILGTVVRGVNGIRAAYVQDSNISEIQADGSIQTVKMYSIFADGTNVEAILENPDIDPTTVQSDSIIEMFEIFGIACARTKIIDELRHQVDAASYRHYTVYADEMTYNGSVTSIDRYGSKKRDASFMLRISDASPLAIIEEAALSSRSDTLHGISAPIMVGKTPEVGDLYNTFKIDVDYVRSQTTSLTTMLDEL